MGFTAWMHHHSFQVYLTHTKCNVWPGLKSQEWSIEIKDPILINFLILNRTVVLNLSTLQPVFPPSSPECLDRAPCCCSLPLALHCLYPALWAGTDPMCPEEGMPHRSGSLSAGEWQLMRPALSCCQCSDPWGALQARLLKKARSGLQAGAWAPLQ